MTNGNLARWLEFHLVARWLFSLGLLVSLADGYLVDVDQKNCSSFDLVTINATVCEKLANRDGSVYAKLSMSSLPAGCLVPPKGDGFFFNQEGSDTAECGADGWLCECIVDGVTDLWLIKYLAETPPPPTSTPSPLQTQKVTTEEEQPETPICRGHSYLPTNGSACVCEDGFLGNVSGIYLPEEGAECPVRISVLQGFYYLALALTTITLGTGFCTSWSQLSISSDSRHVLPHTVATALANFAVVFAVIVKWMYIIIVFQDPANNIIGVHAAATATFYGFWVCAFAAACTIFWAFTLIYMKPLKVDRSIIRELNVMKLRVILVFFVASFCLLISGFFHNVYLEQISRLAAVGVFVILFSIQRKQFRHLYATAIEMMRTRGDDNSVEMLHGLQSRHDKFLFALVFSYLGLGLPFCTMVMIWKPVRVMDPYFIVITLALCSVVSICYFRVSQRQTMRVRKIHVRRLSRESNRESKWGSYNSVPLSDKDEKSKQQSTNDKKSKGSSSKKSKSKSNSNSAVDDHNSGEPLGSILKNGKEKPIVAARYLPARDAAAEHDNIPLSGGLDMRLPGGVGDEPSESSAHTQLTSSMNRTPSGNINHTVTCTMTIKSSGPNAIPMNLPPIVRN